MKNNDTNVSDNKNFNQPSIPANQTIITDTQGLGQNKYPKFDIGGNNYADPPGEAASPQQTIPGNSRQIETSAVEPAFTSPQDIQGVVPPAVSGSPEFTYATLTKRSLASFIDGLIVGAISIVFNLPTYITQFKSMMNAYSTSGSITTPQQLIDTPQMSSSTNPLYTLLSVIGALISVFYSIYFIGKKGATPGKKLMKIKVINKETREVPGMLKAFLREIVGKFVSSVFFFLGYLWAVWDKEKQAWHDKIAGTIVIDDRQGN